LKLPNALQNESGRPDDTTSEMTMDESNLRDQSSSPRVGESDAELAARFERTALVLLDPLYRGALALTGDRLEAEDLLQETMMNAYREFGSFPEGTSPTTWLYRTLISTYVSRCRSRHRRPAECPNTTSIDWQLATAAARSSTGLSLAQVEALEALPTAAITKALHALERDTRMAVYYADVEGFSYREIAYITNRSVSAVMSLLRRGRHQLRNLLLAACRESAADQFRKDAPNNTAPLHPAMPKDAPLHRLSESDPCAGQLDWFDREIVHYVLQWVPHGEMWDEDVYPMFGMTVEQLVDRFHRIIDASVPGLDRLARSDRELVDKARRLPAVFRQAG
jgi:RNA polymerase sigma-70 factor (ECF subfamily)